MQERCKATGRAKNKKTLRNCENKICEKELQRGESGSAIFLKEETERDEKLNKQINSLNRLRG